MSLDVVRQVRSKYPTPLGSTHAAFLLELAPALTATHARDFGLLIKPGGTNIQLPDGTRVSQDVVCDREGIQIDCLMDGEGQAVPAWNHVDPAHYTPDPSRFYAVAGSGELPPPDSTHKYMGGGNDTGTCDMCGQDRHAAVHKIPAASKPHAYDGGEQDTGLCDVCQKPIADAIHDSGVVPPTDDKLEARVAELEKQVDELEGRVAYLEGIPAEPAGLTVEQVQQLIQAELAPLSVSVGRNYGHGHSAALLGRKA